MTLQKATCLLGDRDRFWVTYWLTRAIWTRKQLLDCFHTATLRRPTQKALRAGAIMLFDPDRKNVGWFVVRKEAPTAADWRHQRRMEKRGNRGGRKGGEFGGGMKK